MRSVRNLTDSKRFAIIITLILVLVYVACFIGLTFVFIKSTISQTSIEYRPLFDCQSDKNCYFAETEIPITGIFKGIITINAGFLQNFNIAPDFVIFTPSLTKGGYSWPFNPDDNQSIKFKSSSCEGRSILNLINATFLKCEDQSFGDRRNVLMSFNADDLLLPTTISIKQDLSSQIILSPHGTEKGAGTQASIRFPEVNPISKTMVQPGIWYKVPDMITSLPSSSFYVDNLKSPEYYFFSASIGFQGPLHIPNEKVLCVVQSSSPKFSVLQSVLLGASIVGGIDLFLSILLAAIASVFHTSQIGERPYINLN